MGGGLKLALNGQNSGGFIGSGQQRPKAFSWRRCRWRAGKLAAGVAASTRCW